MHLSPTSKLGYLSFKFVGGVSGVTSITTYIEKVHIVHPIFEYEKHPSIALYQQD